MAITKNGETTFVGATLMEWEHNGAWDSDWYAVVWDDQTIDTSLPAGMFGSLRIVATGTTRFANALPNVTIDATEETLGRAESYLADWLERAITEQEVAESRNPTVGKTVRSLTSRGKNKGAVGTVVAREANPYRTYYRNGYNHPEAEYNQRVLVQIWGEWDPDEADGHEVLFHATGSPGLRMAWIDVQRVEVIDPEHTVRAEYAAEDGSLDANLVRANAEALASHRNWRGYASHGIGRPIY